MRLDNRVSSALDFHCGESYEWQQQNFETSNVELTVRWCCNATRTISLLSACLVILLYQTVYSVKRPLLQFSLNYSLDILITLKFLIPNVFFSNFKSSTLHAWNIAIQNEAEAWERKYDGMALLYYKKFIKKQITHLATNTAV